MTIFGLDVSHYQGSLDPDRLNLRAQGYEFIMAKATEGTGYRDPAYHGFRAQAQLERMHFAAYHFLHGGRAAAQADYFCNFVTDPSIPIMLDLEASGAKLADANAFEAEAKKHGRRVSLLYLPHWYWQRIGEPNLAGWSGRLVASSYPSSAHKLGSALYPGPRGSGWKGYGGVTPTIWQFASSGKITGYSGNVDLDAFEGDRAQLDRLFKNYGPAAKPAPKKPAPPKRVDRPNVDEAIRRINLAVKAAKGHPKVLEPLQAALDELHKI